jgi:hypothetical protein
VPVHWHCHWHCLPVPLPPSLTPSAPLAGLGASCAVFLAKCALNLKLELVPLAVPLGSHCHWQWQHCQWQCLFLWLSSRAPARSGSITTWHDGVPANRVLTTASLRAISHQAYVSVEVLRHCQWHAPTAWLLLRINLRYQTTPSTHCPFDQGGQVVRRLKGLSRDGADSPPRARGTGDREKEKQGHQYQRSAPEVGEPQMQLDEINVDAGHLQRVPLRVAVRSGTASGAGTGRAQACRHNQLVLHCTRRRT